MNYMRVEIDDEERGREELKKSDEENAADE